MELEAVPERDALIFSIYLAPSSSFDSFLLMVQTPSQLPAGKVAGNYTLGGKKRRRRAVKVLPSKGFFCNWPPGRMSSCSLGHSRQNKSSEKKMAGLDFGLTLWELGSSGKRWRMQNQLAPEVVCFLSRWVV